MNYRHHFHAGNFADVMKHLILVLLIKGMQRKEKGFLCLDTHSGRGRYDLESAAQGDTQARKPEWPEGIGRLWDASDLPAVAQEYLAVVRQCNDAGTNSGLGTGAEQSAAPPRNYPGSPWLAQALLREQDRLFLCEKQPEECEVLRDELSIARRVTIQALDGYTALKATLPPPEKRALILIDPPFEAQDEFEKVIEGIEQALRRLPAATIAVWYPLTERARVDAFFRELEHLRLPPCWTTELCVAGEASSLRMRGCGLLVINPPWQLDREISTVLPWLRTLLAQEAGASAGLYWLVSEE